MARLARRGTWWAGAAGPRRTYKHWGSRCWIPSCRTPVGNAAGAHALHAQRDHLTYITHGAPMATWLIECQSLRLSCCPCHAILRHCAWQQAAASTLALSNAHTSSWWPSNGSDDAISGKCGFSDRRPFFPLHHPFLPKFQAFHCHVFHVLNALFLPSRAGCTCRGCPSPSCLPGQTHHLAPGV